MSYWVARQRTMNQQIPHLLKKVDIKDLPHEAFVHPLNAGVTRLEIHLSDALKMKNIGIHLVRLKPNSQSTVAHFHSDEEEFIYILSGKGVARIGKQEVKVEPGDFLGFTAPSSPHLLKNPFAEDLVYLMGGERRSYDVIEYPEIEKKFVKIKNELIEI